MADKKKIELGELLERLTVTGDLGNDSARFRGVAVSRSETALHLGTDGGIVEIPLAEIDEVTEIGGHTNAVDVTVKNPSMVRAIRMAPWRQGEGGTIPSGPIEVGTNCMKTFTDEHGTTWTVLVADDSPQKFWGW